MDVAPIDTVMATMVKKYDTYERHREFLRHAQTRLYRGTSTTLHKEQLPEWDGIIKLQQNSCAGNTKQMGSIS